MSPTYKLLDHVFIIGMPGSGKSTLANKLSDRFGLPIIDIDDLIIHNEGQPISDIWNSQGEFYFRVKERMKLFNVLVSTPKIISTGGGLPCYFNNSMIINKHYSVFLKVNLDDLVLRNANSKNPLFTATPSKDQIASLLERRINYYERANRVIESEDNLEALANNFLNFLLLDGILQSNV